MEQLIVLTSASSEDILVNPNAIVAVYPKGTRTNPFVRFVSGKESDLPIDDPTYQALRRSGSHRFAGASAERVGGAAGGA